jgi:6-pyruvoyltetrahydropterin/6-carboxytetrahydropterin synthase
MYKVCVTTAFSAAHFLKNYKGKCEKLHGHNWKVEACVSSQDINDSGLVIDFSELKNCLNRTVDEFDHSLVNDIEYFRSHNPTSENMAYYIFTKLKGILPPSVKLELVKVWEKDTSCALYQE